MTVIFTSSCDSLTDWTSTAFASIASGGGHTGNGLAITGAGNATFTIPSGHQSRRVNASFWWKVTSVALPHNIVTWFNGVNLQFRLTSSTTGQLAIQTSVGQIAASAASVVAANTWYFIELTNVNIGDSDGSVTVKVGGTAVLTLTGVDLSAGSSGPYPTTEWRVDTTGSGTTQTFDDIALDAVLPNYVKEWNGSAWIDCPAKAWSGSAWVDPLAIKTWNGSAWV